MASFVAIGACSFRRRFLFFRPLLFRRELLSRRQASLPCTPPSGPLRPCSLLQTCHGQCVERRVRCPGMPHDMPAAPHTSFPLPSSCRPSRSSVRPRKMRGTTRRARPDIPPPPVNSRALDRPRARTERRSAAGSPRILLLQGGSVMSRGLRGGAFSETGSTGGRGGLAPIAIRS